MALFRKGSLTTPVVCYASGYGGRSNGGGGANGGKYWRNSKRSRTNFMIAMALAFLQTFTTGLMSTILAVPKTFDVIVTEIAAYWDGEVPTWDNFTTTVETYGKDPSDPEYRDPNDVDGKKDNATQKLAYSKEMMAMYKTAANYERDFIEKLGELGEIKDGQFVSKDTSGSEQHEKEIEKFISKFNTKAGSNAVGNTADKLFGTGNFDPQNNFMSPVMDWVYYIVNTLFNVCSQCLIWFFILQTGADSLYITIDFVRGFLLPFNKANTAGGEGTHFIKMRIVSQEAYDSVYGAAAGDSSSGNNAISKTKVMVYLMKRWPVALLAATYLVLLFGGWWPKLIQVMSGLVIGLLTYVLRFFGISV